MAISTETERRAAISTPWAPTYPFADGVIGWDDRAQAAGFYYISAPSMTAVAKWTAIGAPRVLTVKGI